MREGRWRKIDAEAAAGRWPGADRRRGEQPEQVDREAEHIEPEREVSTASTAATAYRYGDLDADDRARFDALVATFGLSPEFVHPTFHVGRTRRGYVILLTEYDAGDAGQPLLILGSPVLRHHIQPVGLDELPVACRSERAR